MNMEMIQETRKIREDEGKYLICKPLFKGLNNYRDGRDGFESVGHGYNLKELAHFLETNKKKGYKLRIIGSIDIANKLKEHYREREKRVKIAKKKGLYGKNKRKRK